MTGIEFKNKWILDNKLFKIHVIENPIKVPFNNNTVVEGNLK